MLLLGLFLTLNGNPNFLFLQKGKMLQNKFGWNVIGGNHANVNPAIESVTLNQYFLLVLWLLSLFCCSANQHLKKKQKCQFWIAVPPWGDTLQRKHKEEKVQLPAGFKPTTLWLEGMWLSLIYERCLRNYFLLHSITTNKANFAVLDCVKILP